MRRRSSKRRNSQGDALTKEQENSDVSVPLSCVLSSVPFFKPKLYFQLNECFQNTGGSYESLDWDPVDGLHAEKQKPVSDLKRLFDSFKPQK